MRQLHDPVIAAMVEAAELVDGATMALPDGAGQLYAVATRVSVLDVNGFPAAGSNTFTTNTVMKVTATPVMESGDDLVSKNAAGDIAVMFKHGDMPKYFTVAIELATPDNYLEQALAGGTLLTDSAAVLGAVTGSATQAYAINGTLAAGTYGYKVSQYNQYGETVPGTEVTVTTTGSTGSAVIAGMVAAAGAIGLRLYGRTPGQEQLLASLPVVAASTTTTASGTGAGPFNLAVSAGVVASLPAGYTFQITGDTNTPKIVFTTTQEVSKGAVIIPATSSQSVTITVAGGLIVPVFVDNGSGVPSGAQPAADGTAGPGQTGLQAPALGIVGCPNGVSVEMWCKAVLTGRNAPGWPYNRWVMPQVANIHAEARNFTNAILENSFTGDGFQNPNWGAGPMGDWDYDSTKVWQRARRGATDLPTPGLSPVLALA